MDSLGARGARPTCSSCEAMRTLVSAYELADSFLAAERQARRWVRLQPGAAPPANALAEVLQSQGRFAAADSVVRIVAPADPSHDDVLTFRALHLIRAGAHNEADQLPAPKTTEAGAVTRLEAYWQLAISLREQGKLVEALDAVRHIRAPRPARRPQHARAADFPRGADPARIAPSASRGGVVRPAREAGSQRSDVVPSSARLRVDVDARRECSRCGGRYCGSRPNAPTRFACSAAEAATGATERLFHHVRGLLLAARRDDAAAIAEFQAAIYSATERIHADELRARARLHAKQSCRATRLPYCQPGTPRTARCLQPVP